MLNLQRKIFEWLKLTKLTMCMAEIWIELHLTNPVK